MKIVCWFIFFVPVLFFSGVVVLSILIKMGYADKPVRIKRWMTGAGVALVLVIAVPVTCVINDRNEKSCVERREAFERSIAHQVDEHLCDKGIYNNGLADELSELVLKEKAYDCDGIVDEKKLDGLLRIIYRHSIVTSAENE